MYTAQHVEDQDRSAHEIAWLELQRALIAVGLEASDIESIFRVTSAVLLLGNIDFDSRCKNTGK